MGLTGMFTKNSKRQEVVMMVVEEGKPFKDPIHSSLLHCYYKLLLSHIHMFLFSFAFLGLKILICF